MFVHKWCDYLFGFQRKNKKKKSCEYNEVAECRFLYTNQLLFCTPAIKIEIKIWNLKNKHAVTFIKCTKKWNRHKSYKTHAKLMYGKL